MREYELVIIGGGPAGLAAAVAAYKAGIQDILILERDNELGGILNQCIHNGFGLHTFKEELTGPEYAGRFIEQVKELGIPYKLNTMVMDLAADKGIAHQVKAAGANMLRGGSFKPRTSPYDFQGLGAEGIQLLLEAKKETGLPIYTHTTLGTYAPEQAAYFKATGLPMDRIVLGHLDLSGDLDYIRRVLDTGISIGFDTVGKNNYFPDAKRVEFLLALEAEGRLDQVVLSEDLTRKSHLKYKGGIGYCYLFETFIPMLKAAGLKQESLDKMLIHNPARILGI